VERARREKRLVSSLNRSESIRVHRVSYTSRVIIEKEIERHKLLAKQPLTYWVGKVNALPVRFQQKVLHIVYWDYGGRELDKLLKHRVEDVDQNELAVVLYSLGYSATKALFRAKYIEDGGTILEDLLAA